MKITRPLLSIMFAVLATGSCAVGVGGGQRNGARDPSLAVPTGSLQILPSNPSITVGTSVQLRITITDRGTEIALPLSWATSDLQVATVNAQGLVRGVDIGRATITVRSYNGVEGSVVVEVR